jgi:hypothetical protein
MYFDFSTHRCPIGGVSPTHSFLSASPIFTHSRLWHQGDMKDCARLVAAAVIAAGLGSSAWGSPAWALPTRPRPNRGHFRSGARAISGTQYGVRTATQATVTQTVSNPGYAAGVADPKTSTSNRDLRSPRARQLSKARASLRFALLGRAHRSPAPCGSPGWTRRR